MTNQLIIDLNGLSPALKHQLNKAIRKAFFDYKVDIAKDIRDNWSNRVDCLPKQNMIDWHDKAGKSHLRFCKQYPL